LIRRKLSLLLVAFGVLFSAIPAAPAQTNSNKVDVALTALIIQSLSLVVALPTIAFGTVTPGASNAGVLPVSIISAWNLGSGQTVKLYAFFDSASTAMTGTLTGQLIPTSAVKASFNGGATQTFTTTSPFTAGSTAMTLYTVPITAANLIATRTDSLALTLDLTSLNSLPTDAYTGTMHLQAQAL
jgi:hypothetical protein